MKPVFKRLVLVALLMLTPSASLGADLKNTSDPSADLTGSLTLQEVIVRVLLHNPELEAYSLEVRAREARAVQAGLYKNPNILLDVEDVFGSGGFKDVRRSQSTLLLSQVIELGGKRAKRERAALSHKDLAYWDYETARMNILTRVTQAYTGALTAQEKLKLARQLVTLSQNSYNAVKARVDAGKVSPIHEVKAQVALSTTQIEFQQAENNLKAAYRRLATFWGSLTPRFEQLAGNLYLIAPVPAYDTLTAQIQNNPDLARWAAERMQREAAVDLEEANAVPNLKVGAGGRWREETHDNTFVLEFSLPLQLFDRNQGAIAEARHRLAQAEAQRRAAGLKLNAALAESYTRLANAHSRVIALKTQILPGARTAFQAVNEGYRFGKFGYLEVLDSQRTWFNARAQFLDALREYHKAVADVERLTGQAVAPPRTATPQSPPRPTKKETQR
ncbi:MAG: TolC family protein [Nitrospinae bacterium]|nr:TolC family protein [Nitrospinota bacterium]